MLLQFSAVGVEYARAGGMKLLVFLVYGGAIF